MKLHVLSLSSLFLATQLSGALGQNTIRSGVKSTTTEKDLRYHDDEGLVDGHQRLLNGSVSRSVSASKKTSPPKKKGRPKKKNGRRKDWDWDSLCLAVHGVHKQTVENKPSVGRRWDVICSWVRADILGGSDVGDFRCNVYLRIPKTTLLCSLESRSLICFVLWYTILIMFWY